MRLQEERQSLEGRDVHAVGTGQAGGDRDYAGSGATDGDVDVADVVAEQVDDRRLHEAAAAVVRAGYVCTARLPRDPDGAVGAIDRDVWLGRVHLFRRRHRFRETADDVACR